MGFFSKQFVKRGLPVLLAGLLLLAGCQVPADPQGLTPKESYQMEKINEVSDMILAREVIPQDYFRFFPEDSSFQEDLQTYNQMTAELTLNATLRAVSICSALCGEGSEIPEQLSGLTDTHLGAPYIYHEIEARIAHLSLYENAVELCRSDPTLAHIIAPESGGSYGMWPGELHRDWDDPRSENQTYVEYFALIDTLLDNLDTLRSFP